MENYANYIENSLERIEPKQTHIKEFVEHCPNDTDKQTLADSISNLNFPLLDKLYGLFTNPNCNNPTEIKNKSENQPNMSPIESNFNTKDFTSEESQELYQKGLQSISEGKVALLILAGGQGSRLGFEGPKGMYNVKMPSNNTLFEYLSTRFLAVQNLARSKCKTSTVNPSLLCIMTSTENHKATVDFFKLNNYFGISPSDVIFFPQDTLPALDLEGKIIMKSSHEIFQAPNGNGGCFMALKKHKVIDELLLRKVEFLHVISIDNPMSKPLDPFYIGLTLSQGKAGQWQNSAKVVVKRDPFEPVGVFMNVDGIPMMVDYGDMPKDLCQLQNQKGELVYRGGNILNYLISVKLLDSVLLDEQKYESLIQDFHISKKNIPCVKVENGKLINTTTPGIKFELFFNSIFKFSKENGLLLLEVEREEEFAPVKNTEDSLNDNPRTCREMMSRLFLKWYLQAGGKLKYKNEEIKLETISGNRNKLPFNFLFEMSYLLSYEGENITPGENVPNEIEIDDGNPVIYLK